MNIASSQYTTDNIETLRLIIEGERKCAISYDEALEVGESLVMFFKTLGDEEIDETEED